MGKMAVTNVFQNGGCHTLVGRLKNATFKPFYRGCPGLEAPQRVEKCQNPMWCTQTNQPPNHPEMEKTFWHVCAIFGSSRRSLFYMLWCAIIQHIEQGARQETFWDFHSAQHQCHKTHSKALHDYHNHHHNQICFFFLHFLHFLHVCAHLTTSAQAINRPFAFLFRVEKSDQAWFSLQLCPASWWYGSTVSKVDTGQL